jgi:DNA-directed RNA polymerase subunit RPC12/RpoP
MSEFKYACPVCGQHIKCDSSQAGTVMECPTCFQKITVPQAPATGEQKFILTGTRVGERPVPTLPGAGPIPRNAKHSLWLRIALAVLIAAAAATAFAFREKIANVFSRTDAAPAPVETRRAGARPPRLIPPPANETNWTLNLAGVKIPETRAAGRIHGRDFIVERAFLQGGTLTLRYGTRGPVVLGLTIHFPGARPESLAGESFDIATNAPRAARVSLRWPDHDRTEHDNLENGYALRLQFGSIQNNRIEGKIYFCAPDETKSYVAGTFTAEIRKPRTPSD